MPAPRRHLTKELTAGFAQIRLAQQVPTEFSAEAEALANSLAARMKDPALQQQALLADRADRRDVELLSIDPEGSRDLDQALHLERRGAGYRFHYAIADVAAWVQAGDPIDVEARQRGTTIYCPDVRIPLHPLPLSEGAASLLGEVDRPALLWTIDLDAHAEIVDIAVERALVRNRRALSYAAVQAALDAGTTDEQFRLIEEVGTLRKQLEVDRGGVSLDLPAQEVERVGDRYELRYETSLAVEGHNAQLSLCCGIAAARLMTAAGFGLLRTLPPADEVTLNRLRASAEALDIPFTEEMTYPQWVRSLDVTTPQGAALMVQAARTLRGAGYLAFDGNLPSDTALSSHSAIAAQYAHVTAPLRRLGDRFANECVLAAAAGHRPPGWVLDALSLIPAMMDAANRKASAVDRAIVDLTEAALLAHRVGDIFDATVTGTGKGYVTIQIHDPAIVSTLSSDAQPGTNVRVRLDVADVAGPTIRFSLAG
jgi:exoribonuclease R